MERGIRSRATVLKREGKVSGSTTRREQRGSDHAIVENKGTRQPSGCKRRTKAQLHCDLLGQGGGEGEGDVRSPLGPAEDPRRPLSLLRERCAYDNRFAEGKKRGTTMLNFHRLR